jgi:glycosyltransferase involved in cell wall biosynthesis
MTATRSPISALVPIKDGATHLGNLRLQIDRTLSASDEILIIDDASSDATWSLLKSWATEDQRIRLFQNDRPGLANALNLGLKNAQYEWVARYDVDDQYQSDRIEKQLNLVDTNTVAIFSDYNFVTPKGKHLGYIPTGVLPLAVSVSLVASQRTPHPVALILKDAALSVDGYRQSDFPAEDLSLWLRISRVGELKSVSEALLDYVISPNGVSATRRNLQLKTKDRLIKEIGIKSDDLDNAINDYEEIIRSYKSESYSGLRGLLLSREIRLAISESRERKVIKKSDLRVKINVKDIKQIFEFGLQTTKRKLFRRKN